MSDCYPVASVRHFHDGKALQNACRYDGAMSHYAFSTECWIKTIYLNYGVGVPHIHNLEAELKDLQDYYEVLGFLRPELCPLYGLGSMPTELFQGHPSRRYEEDHFYSKTLMDYCERFVENLIRHLISATLDGRIVW